MLRSTVYAVVCGLTVCNIKYAESMLTILCCGLLYAAIRIGFGMQAYTFEEPDFDDFFEVFLEKENNVTSEQTFLISLTVRDSVPINSGFDIAEFGVDYGAIPRTAFIQSFLPGEKRLPISFELRRDFIPERTEGFEISSSNDEREPSFLPPRQPLYPQTFVIIEDDDRMYLNVHSVLYCCLRCQRCIACNCRVVINQPCILWFSSYFLVIV